MKKALFFFLVFPLYLYAQSNEGDTLKLKSSLSLTGFMQGGNVQTLIFRTKADVRYRPSDQFAFRTTNSYVYQEFGKVKADEDILSLNFLNIGPNRKLSPLALAFFSSNFRREIDMRTLLGTGVTYQVFQNEQNWLKMALSSEYEFTRFNATTFNRAEYNGSQTINTLRATIWINGKYHLFDEKLILSHESFYQPSLEAGNNYRWQADFALELPISKYVNFKINYLHTFESIVIVNQHQQDRFLTFGLTVKSY